MCSRALTSAPNHPYPSAHASHTGPYLFKLCGDNKHAGYAEGVQGTFQALASIPAGIFADRYRRDTVLKWSGVIGVIGVILTLVGLAQPAKTVWDVCGWPPCRPYLFRIVEERTSRNPLHSPMMSGTALSW